MRELIQTAKALVEVLERIAVSLERLAPQRGPKSEEIVPVEPDSHPLWHIRARKRP